MAYKYYIKERDNPQLGTYYVAVGKMSKKEAKKSESSLYGTNTMHAYDTLEEYTKAIEELEKEGHRLH